MEPRLCLHLAFEIKIPNLPDSGNSPKVITKLYYLTYLNSSLELIFGLLKISSNLF